uniref:Uncharacterized protein n=1 Tax=Timema tahoe TaxID=61484 RepID=A0A7R9INC2_9NEOP|nr:unnamed protein product [Timema tahoe]
MNRNVSSAIEVKYEPLQCQQYFCLNEWLYGQDEGLAGSHHEKYAVLKQQNVVQTFDEEQAVAITEASSVISCSSSVRIWHM